MGRRTQGTPYNAPTSPAPRATRPALGSAPAPTGANTPGVNRSAYSTNTRTSTGLDPTAPFIGQAGQNVGGFTGLLPTFQPEFRQRAGEGNRFATLDRQRSLLGLFGSLLPENMILRQSDVPLLENNLNFQQRLMAMQDRDTGIGRLEGARQSVGISPESTLARELAVRNASGGGALGEDVVANSRAALRSQNALAAEAAERELSRSLASRGVGGGLAGMAQARLAQDQAVNSATSLADFDLQAASMLQQAEREALSDLQAIAAEEQNLRLALDQLIADQYLNTEYGAIDLSGLLATVPKGGRPVGGGDLRL